ncbi:MAG: hypothetical protein WC069_06020 [Candidatus Shapirobacteria bacterium]
MNEKNELEINKEQVPTESPEIEVTPDTLEINVYDKVTGKAVGPGQL